MDSATKEQELLGERRLAGIGVRNDGKGAAAGDFGCQGHYEFLAFSY